MTKRRAILELVALWLIGALGFAITLYAIGVLASWLINGGL